MTPGFASSSYLMLPVERGFALGDPCVTQANRNSMLASASGLSGLRRGPGKSHTGNLIFQLPMTPLTEFPIHYPKSIPWLYLSSEPMGMCPLARCLGRKENWPISYDK